MDKCWHLAETEEEIRLTECELQLWRVFYCFVQWQEECESIVNKSGLSVDEIAVLHIIRLKDRPKTIADIGRLLNRDNFFSINYNINKLLKAGLIEKLETDNKKQYQYRITELGRQNTDTYVQARKKILLGEFREDLKAINLEEVTNGLIKLKVAYSEAIRVISTYHQPSASSEKDK